MTYQEFLRQKMRRWTGSGFSCDAALLPTQRFSEYQRAIVRWACAKGRAALFADTGLGKTVMQLAWAQQVHAHTGGRVLILAPLAVSWQTCGEAGRYGIDAGAELKESYFEMACKYLAAAEQSHSQSILDFA